MIRRQFRPDDHPTDHFLLTTAVGSYPQPEWLTRVRSLAERGDLPAEARHDAEDDACRVAITEQERPVSTSSRTARCAGTTWWGTSPASSTATSSTRAATAGTGTCRPWWTRSPRTGRGSSTTTSSPPASRRDG